MEPLVLVSHQLAYLVCVVLIHSEKFQTVDCLWDKEQTREGSSMDI